MLSASDNEILCRVGPGMPMGNVFREYWLPAVRSRPNRRQSEELHPWPDAVFVG